MAIRILTKNGIENTNIDGARDNNFNAGQRSGVAKGILSEGNIYANGNSIVLEPCELRICGHRIVIDENEVKSFTNKPQSATKQSLIAQIVVNENDNVEFDLIVQSGDTDLIKNNLDKNGMGTYQLLLATFTQNTDGSISNVLKTFDVITGMTKEQLDEVVNNSSSALNQSNNALQTANTALANSQTAITTANASLTQAGNALYKATEALDRTIDGLGTKVTVDGSAVANLSFSSDPQTQIKNINTNIIAINNMINADINLLKENKANIDLTNVTYPEVVADGVTKMGSSDRVVGSWISSDGLTWCRIWRSGWKECGGRLNISIPINSVTHYVLPVSFSTTKFTIVVSPDTWLDAPLYVGADDNSANGGSSIYIGLSGTAGNSPNKPYIYCCGY